jgi:hypothetical protein
VSRKSQLSRPCRGQTSSVAAQISSHKTRQEHYHLAHCCVLECISCSPTWSALLSSSVRNSSSSSHMSFAMQLRSNCSMPACCLQQYHRLVSLHSPCLVSTHSIHSPVQFMSAAAAAVVVHGSAAAAVHRRHSHQLATTGHHDAPVTAYGQASAAGNSNSRGSN